jgi:hypothetical protein
MTAGGSVLGATQTATRWMWRSNQKAGRGKAPAPAAGTKPCQTSSSSPRIAKAGPEGPAPLSTGVLANARGGVYLASCARREDILPAPWDIHAQAQLGHLTSPRSGAGQGPGRAFGRRRTRVRAEGNVARTHAAAGSTVKSTDEGPGRVVG